MIFLNAMSLVPETNYVLSKLWCSVKMVEMHFLLLLLRTLWEWGIRPLQVHWLPSESD